jgi:HlyD family type I secretion membrane fusion protein
MQQQPLQTVKINNTPAIPVKIRGWVIAGLIILIIAFGGFLGWSTLFPLASAVVASGVIKVDSSRKQIQHLEGGVVKDIFVKDGDHVNAGDVLFTLDQTRAGSSLGILESSYYASLAQQSRLLAEQEGLAAIDFPDELKKQAGDEKIAEIIRSQTQLFNARQTSLQGQLDILDQQIIHLQKEITGLKAQKQSKEKQIVITTSELDNLEELLKKKLIDNTRVLSLEREAARLDGELGEHISDIAAIETGIDEKKLQKFQLKKTFREEVISELRQIQNELNDVTERVFAAKHVLEQTEIRSPVDGIVVGKGVHTIGGVVQRGEILLEIVPEKDRLVIEAKVDPQDIDRVKLGLPTGVNLTSFNQRNTPELNGTVSYVSADIFEEQKTGMPYFIARIEVAQEEINRLKDKKLQPGMLADIFIRTGERTFADYLLEPLIFSFKKAWLED